MADEASSFTAIFLVGFIAISGCPSGVNGQYRGVSLKLHGVTIPNNSLVDFDDILYTSPNLCCNQEPSNANGLHDQTLVCVTDLTDCCDLPRAVRGDWYYPDGRRVEFSPVNSLTFRANRGPNEVNVTSGRRFYGSVRLFRRYSSPPERGHFSCELPSAADPNVNQTLYANIMNFGFLHSIDPVTLSPSGSNTAGETHSLMCSATLFDPIPLPSNVPSPTFEWFFGPNGNASLPSGVTPMTTAMSSNSTSITYTSILQFSPLSQSHAGMYTCRLGAGRLANSANVTVNAPAVSVQITTSGAPVLGQNGYSLICSVNGADNLNPTITYQWTKNNGTQTQIQVRTNSNTLSFSHLRLADAGQYTCSVTVRSAYVSSVARASSQPFVVNITVPEPTVSVHSDSPNPILSGSSPTLTCTMEMNSTVSVPVTVNMVWNGPEGTAILSATRPEMISFTLYTSSNTLDSVKLADSGEYTCTVSFENGVEVSASTNITIVDGMLQLRLKSVGICQQWYNENSDKSEQYSNFIKGALIKAIEHHCKCRFPILNLLNDDAFICEDSPNLLLYRNTLLGTHNFNGTEIIGFIQDWVSTGPLINIGGNSVRVDSSCPVAVSSLDEPAAACGQKKEECLYDDDPKYAMCAEQLNNANIANCFEGCVVRNG